MLRQTGPISPYSSLTRMDSYSKDIVKIGDQYDAGVEEAESRRPGTVSEYVKDGAWLSGYIISLGQKYRRFYDSLPDEVIAQRRFNRKMARITENARYEKIVR